MRLVDSSEAHIKGFGARYKVGGSRCSLRDVDYAEKPQDLSL